MTAPVRPRRTKDDGQITAFFAVFLLALLAVAGLAVDGGRALTAKSEAISLASEAARAGAQTLNLTVLRTSGAVQLDPAQARAHALTFLTRAGARGTVTATTARVTVTVTAAVGTDLLGVVGLRRLTVRATASAAPVTTPLAPAAGGGP